MDYGSATAPTYAAHDASIAVHVYADETRPRSRCSPNGMGAGSKWRSHTIIADNVGGHLMQYGMVDLVLKGTDRTAVLGAMVNKFGTYLKVLAAQDNDAPFT